MTDNERAALARLRRIARRALIAEAVRATRRSPVSEPGPDYTDLLLLIAECLVVLARHAEPDAGARGSRLEAIRAAKGTP